MAFLDKIIITDRYVIRENHDKTYGVWLVRHYEKSGQKWERLEPFGVGSSISTNTRRWKTLNGAKRFCEKRWPNAKSE